jgi:hypothetical protein
VQLFGRKLRVTNYELQGMLLRDSAGLCGACLWGICREPRSRPALAGRCIGVDRTKFTTWSKAAPTKVFGKFIQVK